MTEMVTVIDPRGNDIFVNADSWVVDGNWLHLRLKGDDVASFREAFGVVRGMKSNGQGEE